MTDTVLLYETKHISNGVNLELKKYGLFYTKLIKQDTNLIIWSTQLIAL